MVGGIVDEGHFYMFTSGNKAVFREGKKGTHEGGGSLGKERRGEEKK